MNSLSRFAATIIWLSSFVFISNIAWGQAQDPAAMIQRFDKDSDGQISRDEAPAFKLSRVDSDELNSGACHSALD